MVLGHEYSGVYWIQKYTLWICSWVLPLTT
jgi:hypothetical protein